METFLHSVASVTIILLLTATGYFCAAKGWMSTQVKAFLGKFLLSFAVPCMCIYGLTSNLDRSMILQAGTALVFLLCLDIVLVLLSWLCARLLKLSRAQIGVFVMMCSLSNAIFVGYAMCSELFGPACSAYVMLYYLVNTTFVQFIGGSLIRWGGSGAFGFSLRTVRRFLTTPAVLAVFVGFFLIITDIQLPSLVMNYMKYLNNTVTPMALVLTGYIIYEIGLKNIRIDRTLAVMLLFRFIISPALCLLGCSVFGITGLARSVFVIEAAMPVVTQTVVFASEYGADEKLAAQGAALSTLACFIVIPVLMQIL